LINNVSTIMGAQTNDSNKGMQEYPMKVSDYKARVREQVGAAFLGRALELYPPDYENLVRNVHTVGSIGSDSMLCWIRRRTDLVNRHNPGKAFMYRFNYCISPIRSAVPTLIGMTTQPGRAMKTR